MIPKFSYFLSALVLGIFGCDESAFHEDAPDPFLSENDAATPPNVVQAVDQAPLGVSEIAWIKRSDNQGSAVFAGLGDLSGGEFASGVTGVSASGRVVVGWSVSEAGRQAVRWTPRDGLVSLGGGAGQATAISPNGRWIAGFVESPESITDIYGSEFATVGVVWCRDDAPEILGGYPSDGGIFPWEVLLIEPKVVLNDGSVYGTGIQYGAYGDAIPLYMDAEDEFEIVPGASEILAADAAGFYVGTRYAEPRSQAGFRSVALSSEADLGYPVDAPCVEPHECGSVGRGFSRDRAIVVGTSSVPPPCNGPDFESCPQEPLSDTAFIDSATEPMLRLADVEGGDEASGAFSVDAAGRVIVGFGTTSEGPRAVVWVDRIPRLLEDILAVAGVDSASGWILQDVIAISPDGRTLVGNGINPDGQVEGFRVVLRRPL